MMHCLGLMRLRALSAPVAFFLISLPTLQNALDVLGYPAVTLFILIESAGVPFPGETMLLLASFYAGTYGHLQLSLVIACAAAGAIIGDNIGYGIGHSGGRALIERFGRYFFVKPHHLDYAQKFFVRHGNKTVFLGRFVTFLRIWSAFLAGVNHMPRRAFFFYNAAGGIAWATLYGTLGYAAGHFFHDDFGRIERLVSAIGWAAGGLCIVVLLIAFFFWRRRAHRLSLDESSLPGSQEVQEPEQEPQG